MIRRLLLSLLLLLLLTFSAGADNFLLVNTVVQQSSYPLVGADGVDRLNYLSAGVSFISYIAGESDLGGLIQLNLPLPTIETLKIAGGSDVRTDLTGTSRLGLDLIAGPGRSWGDGLMKFLLGGGLHIGGAAVDLNTLISVGLGASAFVYVQPIPWMTFDLGVGLTWDLWGTHSYGSYPTEFAGNPVSASFYSGFGFSW